MLPSLNYQTLAIPFKEYVINVYGKILHRLAYLLLPLIQLFSLVGDRFVREINSLVCLRMEFRILISLFAVYFLCPSLFWVRVRLLSGKVIKIILVRRRKMKQVNWQFFLSLFWNLNTNFLLLIKSSLNLFLQWCDLHISVITWRRRILVYKVCNTVH